MQGQRSTEEQIIGILNEAEQTGNIREVCKRNNITETTFYRWRAKLGGMEVSDAKRLREIEKENARLKRMVPEPYGHRGVDAGIDTLRVARLPKGNGARPLDCSSARAPF